MQSLHIDEQVRASRGEGKHAQLLQVATNSCVQHQLKLSEVLSIVENKLSLQGETSSSPFLASIQTRLAAFAIIPDCIQHERDALQMTEQNISWSDSTLNSIVNPELTALLSLQTFGLDMLRYFCQHLQLFASSHQEAYKPIQQLCRTFCGLKDLGLFPCWSPRSKRPLRRVLPINVECFAEDDTPVLQGEPNVWSCCGGSWSAKFSAAKVTWIKVSWVPAQGKQAVDQKVIGAPRRVAIFIRSTAMPEGQYERIAVIEPDVVKKEQGSWQQFYLIDRRDIAEVRLSFSSGQSKFNSSSTTKVYGFEALVVDDAVDWVDVRVLLKDTQDALLPLLSVPALRSDAFSAIVATLRSSGSLGICLRFAKHLLSERMVDYALEDAQGDALVRLLTTIHAESRSLREVFNQTFSAVEESMSVCFNDKHKHGGAIIDHGKTFHVHPDESACCYFGVCLEGGLFNWTLEVPNGHDSVSFGLAKNTVNLCDSVDSAWLVHCETGKLTPVIGRHAVALPSGGKVFQFTYSSVKRLLSLSCDGISFGVIFEQVPAGLWPVVFVKKCPLPMSITLVQYSRTKCLSTSPMPLLELIDFPATLTMKSAAHGASILVREIGDLAGVRIHLLEAKSSSANDLIRLEFPFCVEVALAVVSDLVELLEHAVCNDLPPAVLVSTLTVLELQFFNLNLSKLQFKYAECSVEEQLMDTADRSWQVRSCVVMASVNTCLLKLMNFDSVEVRTIALRGFCRGFCIFLPSFVDRVQATIQVMTGHHSRNQLAMLTIMLNSLTSSWSSSDLLEYVAKGDECVLFQFIKVIAEAVPQIDDISNDSAFLQAATTFLVKLEEQAFADLIQGGDDGCPALQDFVIKTFLLLVEHSVQALSTIECQLKADPNACVNMDGSLRVTILGKVLFPLIHAISCEGIPMSMLADIISSMSALLEAVNRVCVQSRACRDALHLISATVKRERNTSEVKSIAGGWKTVSKAAFEDSDGSFVVTENGSTYTSSHSSNTCAMIPIKFSPGQRGAWEFLLEADSVGDECSVFGAARLPLSSRCYSSSPDLWMRRAYNGYMYVHGNTIGNHMEKIHPGDTVRIEFDGVAGTLSFSINGSDLEVGFTDITEDIYPACGSYRNGVTIKLLKVEIFEHEKVADDDGDLMKFARTSNPAWVHQPPSNNARDPTLLCHHVVKDKKKKTPPVRWLTAKCNAGVLIGCHDWAFEFGESIDGPFAVGLSMGDNLPEDVQLAGELGRVGTATTFNYQSMFEQLDQYGGAAERNLYFMRNLVAFAWRSDGTLWFNGMKVHSHFGLDVLPLRSCSTVVVRIDRYRRTVEYHVNGKCIGTAFGPISTGAACSLALPAVDHTLLIGSTSKMHFVHPSASIFGQSMCIRIRPAGTVGSIVLPFMLTMRQTIAAVISRVAARLLEGGPVSKEELSVLHWLRSPLFIGGVDCRLAKKLVCRAKWIEQIAICPESAEIDLSAEEAFVLGIALCEPEQIEHNVEVKALYEYLEALDPESSFLRIALERSNSFRFPTCELPFIACLLKQSGLVPEAMQACTRSAVGQPPSEDMFLLWQKVKQLRTFLRQKRQKMRGIENEGTSTVESADNLEGSMDQHAECLARCKLAMDERGFAFQTDIDWHDQVESCQSVVVDVAKCSVVSIGLDLGNGLAYVVCSVQCTQRFLEKSDGLLKVSGLDLNVAATLRVSEQHNQHAFVQRFDLSKLSKPFKMGSGGTVEYYFQRAGGTAAAVKFVKSLDCSDCSSFVDVCEFTRARALLLLTLCSNLRELDSHTRFALLGLTARYSGASTFFRNKAELTRWRTQERWKRVVEFLRVHSKIRQQLSDESGPTADQEHCPSSAELFSSDQCFPVEELVSPKQDLSNTQAALQACAVFVCSEDNKCSANTICSSISVRMVRARYRTKALAALHQLLVLQPIAEDPYVLCDLLSAVGTSLSPSAIHAVDKTSPGSEGSEDSHYLKFLEGCSAPILSKVQRSFNALYETIAGIVANYVEQWDTQCRAESTQYVVLAEMPFVDNKLMYPAHVFISPLILLLRLWMLRFSTRDFGWIVKSGILPVLYKLGSLSFQERVARTWAESADRWLDVLSSSPEGALSDHNIKMWPPDFVYNGFKQNAMTCRSLLLHSLQASRLGRLNAEGLINSIYGSNACDATKLYCKVLDIFTRKLEKEEQLKKKLDEEKAVEEAKKLQELSDRQSICGMFDPNNKGGDIVLQAVNMEASLREDESGVSLCVYSTIFFDGLNATESSGNYFEVTILQAGMRDIGVGFADNDTFPVRDRMPGWDPHSYGYHGDDGRKYGERSTPGVYPGFEVGDVIGCGYDRVQRSVFFTRNGMMLGTAFTEINEEKLWPVVGFSNRHDEPVKVGINFGLEPFAFSGDGIIPHLKVLEELQLRRRLEMDKAVVSEIAEPSPSVTSATAFDAIERIQLLESAFRAADAYFFESNRLRNIAGSLLRTLLILCVSKDSEQASNESAVQHSKISSGPLTLTKDFSTYGTPRAFTAVDGANLNESILSSVMHEVLIGAKYLNALLSGGSNSIAELEEKMFGFTPVEMMSAEARVVLEYREVEQSVLSHLQSLSVLVDSRQLSSVLCAEKSIYALLMAVDCGPTVSQVAMTILITLLPSLDSDVVESAAMLCWKSKLDGLEAAMNRCNCKRRLRRMPDTLIRVMLLEASRQFRYGGGAELSQQYSFGSSSLETICSLQRIKLIQKLFEAPHWSELIACALTDALRNAHIAVELLSSSPDGIDCALAKDCALFVFVSCAAILSLNQLPLMVPGSLVEVEGNGGGGIVVDCDHSSRSVLVVLESCLEHFLCRQNVETVDVSKVSVVERPTRVDLSRLSQPVLTQMLSLAKLVLVPLMKDIASFSKSIPPLIAPTLRLSNILFVTLSVLLSRQTEGVLDIMHDADLVNDMIMLSKVHTKLPRLLSLSQLLDTWLFFHARCSEQDGVRSELLSLTKDLATDITINGGEQQGLGCDGVHVPISTIATDRVEVSYATRAARREELRPIAQEFGLELDICVGVAEYNMMDMDRTRQDLSSMVSPSPAELSLSAPKPIAAVTNVIVDANPTKGVEYSPQVIKTQTTPLFYRRLVCIDSAALVCGDYVVESTSQGIDETRYGRVAIVEQVLSENTMVVKLFHQECGLAFCNLVNCTQYRKVLFFEKSVDSFHEEVLELDWAVTVAAMRSTVLRLLVCGAIDFTQRTDDDSVPLLKLLVTTGTSSLGDDAMTTVCNTLATPSKLQCNSVSGSEDGNMLISKLLDDATTSLNSICSVCLISADGLEKLSPFSCRSTHPYVAPANVSAKIILPAEATGAQIEFNPLCHLASPLAKLKFYTSEESFRCADAPVQEFCGGEGHSIFKSFSISSQTLFFTFESPVNSDREPMKILSQGDAVVKSGRQVGLLEVPNIRRVGLGEDDSLFNLFDESPQIEENSQIAVTLHPDCSAIVAGVWYFEIEISVSEQLMEDGSPVRIGLVEDFVPSENCLDLTSSSALWVVSSDGAEQVLGSIVRTTLCDWMNGDLISVVVEIENNEYRVCFARNNSWSSLHSGTFVGSGGVRPVISLSGQKHKVSANFGDGYSFKGSIPPEIVALFNAEPKPLACMKPARNDMAWGYEFKVQPLSNLALVLTRDFELVWHFKAEDSSNRTVDGAKSLWVWRAKKFDGYYSLGDVISTVPYPPSRGVMVHNSLCKVPLSFKCVFHSSKLNLVVWRPTPPDGYVAMGDVVVIGSSTSVLPPADCCMCIPEWSVVTCDLKQSVVVVKKVGEGKNLTNASLWTINHAFGYFFGSPYEVPTSTAKRHGDFKCDGVGECYQFRLNIEALVMGEWQKEEDILCKPSLSWSCRLLTTLLTIPQWRPHVIKGSVFLALVNYLKSSLAVCPQRVVPILIQMVRHATAANINLPLESVQSMCKAILTDALVLMAKKTEIPKALMTLIDLVIEIQSVNVLESFTKDCSTMTNYMIKHKNSIYRLDEGKEEDPLNVIEAKEDDACCANTLVDESRWWERPELAASDLKMIRVLKADSVETVFSKESVLLKLRQVLKFLHAIGYEREGIEDRHLYPRLERSFPKLMTTRVWFERVSTSTMVESMHPYREKAFQRKVRFPGTEELQVVFDQRCCLAVGDKLTITSDNHEIVLQGPWDGKILLSGAIIKSDHVTITFIPAEQEAGDNLGDAWGWSLLICASGHVFESAEVLVDLKDALEKVKDGSIAIPKPIAVERASLGEVTAGGAADIKEEAETSSVDSATVADGSGCGPLTGVIQMAESSTLTAVDELQVDAITDSETRLIVSFGQVIARESISIPFATKLDVKISRSGCRNICESGPHEYALSVTSVATGGFSY